MKIPALHYAVLILKDDLNLNARQISQRLNLSLRYVYTIKNRYDSNQQYEPTN